ncbi:MAG: CpaD family pilus assembly protein [Magnetovibrio sp.]|nr:CpaD family pilus assembly protein [Magnetovibrio sp.]
MSNSDTTQLFTKMCRFTLMGACALIITACADKNPREGHDYRQNHRIQVASEPIAVTITLPSSGTALSPVDAEKFRGFLRTFVQRGKSHVTVETTQPALARDVLMNHGLREGEFILTRSNTLKAPNTLLSFMASKAVSPECGDWSTSPTFVPSSKLHSNFGCSVQRNIGEMVSDPNALIKTKPATGKNASRSDAAIFNHQSGAAKTRLFDSDE